MQVLAEVNVKYLLTRIFQDYTEAWALGVGVTGLGKEHGSSTLGGGGVRPATWSPTANLFRVSIFTLQ
jgi:hypothetical protein